MTLDRLVLCPITLKEAARFVVDHHRHHAPPQGALFAVAASVGDAIRGVVIVGRPVARNLDDGWTAEVTRLCTDGARNACSLLYAAAWRAARAMGYRRLVTYTLVEEGGQACERPGGDSWVRRAADLGRASAGRASISIPCSGRCAGRRRHDP